MELQKNGARDAGLGGGEDAVSAGGFGLIEGCFGALGDPGYGVSGAAPGGEADACGDEAGGLFARSLGCVWSCFWN